MAVYIEMEASIGVDLTSQLLVKDKNKENNKNNDKNK